MYYVLPVSFSKNAAILTRINYAFLNISKITICSNDYSENLVSHHIGVISYLDIIKPAKFRIKANPSSSCKLYLPKRLVP